MLVVCVCSGELCEDQSMMRSGYLCLCHPLPVFAPAADSELPGIEGLAVIVVHDGKTGSSIRQEKARKIIVYMWIGHMLFFNVSIN